MKAWLGVLAALSLAFAPPASAQVTAVTAIGGISSGTTTVGKTAPFTLTVGGAGVPAQSFVVVSVLFGNANQLTVVDTKGNCGQYTQSLKFNPGQIAWLFTCWTSVALSPTDTISVSASTADARMAVTAAYVSGFTGTPTIDGTGTGVTGTTVANTAIGPIVAAPSCTTANCGVVFGLFDFGTAGTADVLTENGGFTNSVLTLPAAVGGVGEALSFKLVSSAASVSYSPQVNPGGHAFLADAIAFKAGGAVATCVPMLASAGAGSC